MSHLGTRGSARESRAKRGDWIYLDPPYIPDREWGDFKRYTPGQFPEEEHDRLAGLMWKADKRGAYLMLTNFDTRETRRAFKGFRVKKLATRRDITLKSADRDSTDLVITNY